MIINEDFDADSYEIVVRAGEVMDIDLCLSDTPHWIPVLVQGGCKKTELIDKDGEAFIRVEADTNDGSAEVLEIDVMPTGAIFNLNEVHYLGTALWGWYVWHIFINDDSNAHIWEDTNDKTPKDPEDVMLHLERHTIYKYPLNIDGETSIVIDSYDVTPLYAGLQLGEPMLWAALALWRSDTLDIFASQGIPKESATLEVLCSESDTEDGYELLNSIKLKDGSKKNVFYKCKYNS